MYVLNLFFSEGLRPPSLVHHFEDKIGYLGEDIVIESPIKTGKITWFVCFPNSSHMSKMYHMINEFHVRFLM